MAGNQPKKEKPPAEIVSKAARISSNKMENNSQNQRVQAGISRDQLRTNHFEITRINTPVLTGGTIIIHFGKLEILHHYLMFTQNLGDCHFGNPLILFQFSLRSYRTLACQLAVTITAFVSLTQRHCPFEAFTM